MSGPRLTYRVYCFDGLRRTLNADLLEADSDETVIAIVESSGFGTKSEIWHGDRLVAELQAARRQA